MKFSATLAFIVILGLVASSSALPAKKRMVYLQQQPQWYGAPQRMMYVQYVQPSRTHARSTQAAAALVAGESVATGTYLNDCDHAEADIAVAGPAVDAAQEQQASEHGEDILGAAGAHASHSVAEAYPEENEVQAPAVDAQVAVDADVAAEGAAVNGATVELEVENTDAKVPRDYNFDAETEAEAAEVELPVAAAVVPAVELPVVEVAADLPAPAPIAPVAKPARRYLPVNKKIYVELEQSAEAGADETEEHDEAVVADAEEDDDEEADAAPVVPVNPVRVPNARRPAKKAAAKPTKAGQSAGAAKPTKAPLPVGNFFPIDFGGTAGGAIAIANSFSTGEGGSATSHAIAYGSPDAARNRARPSKFH